MTAYVATDTYAPREITRQPSTERTRRLKERYLEAEMRLDLEWPRLITEYLKEREGQPVVERKGGAFRYAMERLAPIIRDDELIVGCQSRYIRGSHPYPEFAVKWIKEELERGLGKEQDETFQLGEGGGIAKEHTFIVYKFTEEDRKILEDLIAYWEGRSLECISRRYFHEMGRGDELDGAEATLLVTPMNFPTPEGRFILDYEKVLNLGFNGIIREIEEKERHLNVVTMDDFKKAVFYRAAKDVCCGIIAWANNYATEAEQLALKETDPQRKKELKRISEHCRWVPANPPRTFFEALQSFWFIHLAGLVESGAMGMSPGRFDQYMYPFYTKDKEEGRITKEETIELLECLRIKFSEVQRVASRAWEGLSSGNLFQNMILGGITPKGDDAANELSHLLVESAMTLQTVQPTLSIRYNDKVSEDFLLKGVDLIKTGIGMPAWFNDAVAIPHFLRYTGATLEEARDYAMGGCSEMQLPGNRYGINVPGFLNEAKCLELALNDGVDPVTGREVGAKTGPAEDMDYEQVFEAYKKQQAHGLRLQADFWNLVMGVHRDTVPLVYCSVLTDDCIEKGLCMDDGGVRYKDSPTLLISGMINVANSLAGIKKCVFEDGALTIKELKKALAANFEGDGYGEVHEKLLAAPKFGNDDDYVDSIAKRLYEAYYEEVYRHRNYFGVPYTPAALSISAHPTFGRACGALPDGRKAGVSLCDAGISAFPGTDTNGPTALVLSGTKIDAVPTLVVLFNMKFHPTALTGIGGSKNLLSLVKTFFDLGGWHIQFNVVDSRMLRDAQLHPENYRDLIVRVAGFSAYWVELSKQVQDEVIARTEYASI
jgi:formate C-acetyltransferase/4-hydroxyphenylacetate decarboxylase large subunit